MTHQDSSGPIRTHWNLLGPLGPIRTHRILLGSNRTQDPLGPRRTQCSKIFAFQISDEWVMTAAHCVADADAMTVFLGAHNVKEETEEGTVVQI